MADHFLDTSALGKLYHAELGTTEVDRLLNEPGAGHFISRLSVVEIQSMFAGKVRTNVLTRQDFELLRRRFAADVAGRRLNVVRMTSVHYREAERLIRAHGMARSIRTLDALQLAVALSLQRRGMLGDFVCADRNLCAIATIEGLSVINPEHV